MNETQQKVSHQLISSDCMRDTKWAILVPANINPE
jgi:hypothetical protein